MLMKTVPVPVDQIYVPAQLRRIQRQSVSLAPRPPRPSVVAGGPALCHSAESGTARHPAAGRVSASITSCTKRSFRSARAESTKG